MIPLSVLDLPPGPEAAPARRAPRNAVRPARAPPPVPEGPAPGRALRTPLGLARTAERLGYNRFWMAEHHSMPGIASAATAVALAHVGSQTGTIRIGAGGIMLPNHAPLAIAEQFGTLESLYPGRVDLGLGRAPGTDEAAAPAQATRC